MIRTGWSFCALLCCLLTAGCRRERSPSLGMADTTFINTLSELRRIETDTSLDVTMRDSTRHMVLRRHKVTAAKLELAARALAQSPARASDIWRRIESVPRGNSPPTAPPGNSHPVPKP